MPTSQLLPDTLVSLLSSNGPCSFPFQGTCLNVMWSLLRSLSSMSSRGWLVSIISSITLSKGGPSHPSHYSPSHHHLFYCSLQHFSLQDESDKRRPTLPVCSQLNPQSWTVSRTEQVFNKHLWNESFLQNFIISPLLMFS